MAVCMREVLARPWFGVCAPLAFTVCPKLLVLSLFYHRLIILLPNC